MTNFRFHKHFIASALSLQLASCGSNADFDDFVLEDTQSASETGSQTPQGDQALPEALYTEPLIDDAELSVYAVGTTNMVSVTAPAEPSAAFLGRLQAASAEVSLDGLYRAWTGKETLPAILVDRAEVEQVAAQHRAEQTDELDPVVPTEE